VWVFRLLVFRLMLESGAVKLLSGDPSWRNLTAMSYHYETQPLPTPLAWYAYQLPSIIQKASTVGVLVIELAVPFLFLTTSRLRKLGPSIPFGFQILIALPGNYPFFNLLTILLCLLLFIDVKAPERIPWTAWLIGIFLIPLGLLQLASPFGIWRELPEPLATI